MLSYNVVRVWAVLMMKRFHVWQKHGQRFVNEACVPVEKLRSDEVAGEFARVDATKTPPGSKTDRTYAGNVTSDWAYSPPKRRTRLQKSNEAAASTEESGQPKSK